jgi:hypothetical protein
MPKAEARLQFDTLSIEGGLFTAEWLGKVASFKAPGQTDADYAVRAGFSTREEIALAWRSAQHLWGQFKAARQPSAADAWAVTQRFVTELLRQSFGFTNLHAADHPAEIKGRRYPVGHFAVGQSVPLVISVCSEAKLLDTPHDRLGDNSGERLRRRSAFGLLQEFLNAAGNPLWGIASNGLLLRIARDNGSLTRPAWLEADLERLFEDENQAEFSVLWLLLHASRFGSLSLSPLLGEGRGGGDADSHDCILEQWRNACRDQGTQARGLLRRNVEQALEDLGQGFVSHPANTALREALGNGSLSTRDYFRQLMRLVYRLIFLLTVEERGILHPPGSSASAAGLFARGYSLKRLRDKAVRRSAHDRHHDQWEGQKRVWLGLAEGEPRLALPALGGLFAISQCPALDGAWLENRHLLAALFHLAWLRDAPGEPLTRVNWRDMGSEELGSIYESLLELTPQLAHDNRHFSFLQGAATKGNARKTSGSYYTPDSLVQELLDSALEPVVAERLAPHGGALASGEAAARAVLSITVCDPACGSGHFILAAARRLATHLARVQTEGGQPTADDYRHALRQVVTHCIHGVDLNPMAVELAKIALWLEAYTPDAPLGFINHHMRCGDALLGVLDPAILENGIPDKAFNALSGDDKQVVKALKKANKDAQKSIAKIQREGHMPNWQEAVGQAAALETLPDDTLAAVEAKRAAFTETEAAVAQSRARIAADLFVAAFVLPKTPQNKDVVPTSQDLWLVMNGEAPRAGVRDAAAQAAGSARALHWWQVFPQVQDKGGFDVLLGNPPWEVSQLSEEEYFAARAPSIAAMSGEPRKRAIAALEQDNPILWDSYVRDCQKIAASNTYFRESGRFPLTGVGKLNTYSLFAETFSQLLAADGRAGFIVPSGIGTDDTNKRFFQYLVDDKKLVSFFGFDNAIRIFPAVHPDTPFALITIGDGDGKSILTHYILSIEQLADTRRRFTLTDDEFALINPNTRTCPVFRSQHDLVLTKKLYRSAPVLIPQNKAKGVGWNVEIIQNFFSTSNKNDRALFVPAKEVDTFEGLLPVFRGTMIDQFNHHAATFSSSTDSFVEVPADQHQDAEPSSDKYLPMAAVQERLVEKGWRRHWLLGWRDITNATNKRTLISSAFPVSGADDTLSLILPHIDDPRLTACLLGNLNSLVLDYITQVKVGGTHVRKYVISQLPVIPPEGYTEADLQFVLCRVIELTYTAKDMKPWAEDLGYVGSAFAFNPERRALLRAELDACYARLYGLTRDELRYILDPAEVMGADYPSETFRVLKNSEMRQFGEYRTGRLVLAAWDRMAGEGTP